MSNALARPARVALIVATIAATGLLVWIGFQVLFPWWIADSAFDRMITDFTEAGYNPLLVRGAAILLMLPLGWAVTASVRLDIWQRLRGRGGAALIRRRLAMLLITGYLAGYFFLLYGATRQTYFGATTGRAMKYYAVTPEGVRFFDAPGADPKYGIALKPVDSATMVNLKRAELGQAPTRVMFSSIEGMQFFDSITGQPRLWYYEDPAGGIELFSAAGVHPAYGAALKPVSADIVKRLGQRATERRTAADAAAAEIARQKATAAETASREREAQEIARLVNTEQSLNGPVVVARSADGRMLAEVAERIASGLGGSGSYFKARFASDGGFGRAFQGDPEPLKRLMRGRRITSVVLVSADVSVADAGMVDKDLLRGEARLSARIFLPGQGFSSRVVSATGVAAAFRRDDASTEALSAAERDLIAKLRRD
jgi:hypothetical protein